MFADLLMIVQLVREEIADLSGDIGKREARRFTLMLRSYLGGYNLRIYDH